MMGAQQQQPPQPSSQVTTPVALGASSGGPDYAHLQQVADQLNGSAPVRRAWEVRNGKWLRLEGTGGTAPTTLLAEGQIYDEGVHAVFEDVHRWISWRATLAEPMVESDQEDEEDEDYDPAEDSDAEDETEDDDEEQVDDDVDMMADASSSSGGGMDLDARRAEAQRALARPVETSLLSAPVGASSRTLASNDKFKKDAKMQTRTTESGPVTIELQTVMLLVGGVPKAQERPIKVSGLVEPTVTTGRAGAPDPLSGVQVYSGGGKAPSASIATARNNGMPDVERGHVMALELGGPDIPENIVPQWGKFQGSGVWRRMEVGVLAKAQALKKGQRLHYSVDIFYKSSGSLAPTLRTFGFPTGFRTTTQVIDAVKGNGTVVVEFAQGQAQDQTDTMMADRKLSKADGKDWDHALDIMKAKAKAKDGSGKKKSTAKKKDGFDALVGITKPAHGKGKKASAKKAAK